MITAANRTTKQAQEILSAPSGAVLTTPEECQSLYVTFSDTFQTGPCRLVGAILNVGTEVATLVVESDAEVVLRTKMTSGSRPVFPTLPIYCPGNLTVTITGAGADALIYWVPM